MMVRMEILLLCIKADEQVLKLSFRGVMLWTLFVASLISACSCLSSEVAVQVLISQLGRFPCEPHIRLVYLRDLDWFREEPGIQWVPSAGISWACEGYCAGHCMPSASHGFNQTFMKLDRVHHSISFVNVTLTNHTQCACTT